jgi:hypothetical protein
MTDVSTLSQMTARAALAASVLAVLMLSVLHVVQPELAPSSHMISEYAIGPHGWLMTLSFAAFAASSAAALIAVASAAWRTITGKIGLGFLLLASIGLAMGAAFPMDPATTSPDAMSFSGRMHGVAFMIGVPGQILSVLLLSLALRKSARWRSRPLVTVAAAVWLCLGIMIATLIAAAPKPGVPPSGVFGIPNRAFMVAYAAWLALAVWPLVRGSGEARAHMTNRAGVAT